MRILALDAALGPCSAALVDDGVLRAQSRSDDPRGASAMLPGLVTAVLAEAGPGFDAVAVTIGPGSFTGLRAALALAHGLAIGAGVPVIGVSAADAMAAAWPPVPGTALWVAIDMRRGRVFLHRDGQGGIVAVDTLLPPDGPVLVAGDAAGVVAAQIGAGLAGVDRIEARFVALAAAKPAHRLPALPLYVEPPAAQAVPSRPAPA